MSLKAQNLAAMNHGRLRPHRDVGARSWRCACCRAAARPTAAGTQRASQPDVIVVGGGIAGLVAAARLAKEGLAVTLLEQNGQVGGRCQSQTLTAPLTQTSTVASTSLPAAPAASEGSFRFDTGPSLLLFPDTYRRTYASLGHDMADHVQLRRVQPAAYRVFFEGAGHLDMLYDVQAMVAQLEAVEPGAGQQYIRWLASARTALDVGMSQFIERDFDGLLDMLDLRRLLPLLPRLNLLELLGQHHDRLGLRFKDERLRAMFTFQDLYVGLSPYNAPGAFSLLAATELTDGVWYPVGGFQTVRDSLLGVAESLGVEVCTGARVRAIDTCPRGEAVTGVTLEGGETLRARVVVANRDLPLAYGLLDGGARQYGQRQQERVSALDFSAGVIAYNWCLSQPLVPHLLHHNVFLSSEHAASWQRACAPGELRRCPNFYVHVPSRTDPTAAPPGCESVMVLLPVANLQQLAASQRTARGDTEPSRSAGPGSGPTAGGGVEDAYKELVDAGREAVLRALCEGGATGGGVGVEQLRAAIAREMVIDPVQWAQRYGLQHGAAFGLSHGLAQLSAMRPALKDPRVRGLYFTGASTRPGNGVPLAMISADLVVQRVLKDLPALKT